MADRKLQYSEDNRFDTMGLSGVEKRRKSNPQSVFYIIWNRRSIRCLYDQARMDAGRRKKAVCKFTDAITGKCGNKILIFQFAQRDRIMPIQPVARRIDDRTCFLNQADRTDLFIFRDQRCADRKIDLFRAKLLDQRISSGRSSDENRYPESAFSTGKAGRIYTGWHL